jgi:hypothetical protein
VPNWKWTSKELSFKPEFAEDVGWLDVGWLDVGWLDVAVVDEVVDVVICPVVANGR